MKLEKVLGSTARFWLGLEAQYREQLARKADVVGLAADVGWLKELPLPSVFWRSAGRGGDDAHQHLHRQPQPVPTLLTMFFW